MPFSAGLALLGFVFVRNPTFVRFAAETTKGGIAAALVDCWLRLNISELRLASTGANVFASVLERENR